MAEEHSKSPHEPAVATELRTLLQQAQRGDPTALPRIRKILNDDPTLCQLSGKLSRLVREAWMAVLSDEQPVGGTEKKAEEDSTFPQEPPIAGELRAPVKRAQTGDPTALLPIRSILDQHSEIWQQVGNLSSRVEQAWMFVLAANNPLLMVSIKRTVAEMRSALAGEHATVLEKLMVDQVIVCWMELKHVQSLLASPESTTLNQASFQQKRLDSSQRRFESAIKTLTSVRSLLPTSLAPAQAVKLHGPQRRQVG